MTATLPPTTQSLNDALGNLYAIDRELGHGGMATVYLAQDVRHNRLVALKVLHAEIAESLGAKGWHHKEWLSHDTDFKFVRESDRYRRIVAEI